MSSLNNILFKRFLNCVQKVQRSAMLRCYFSNCVRNFTFPISASKLTYKRCRRDSLASFHRTAVTKLKAQRLIVNKYGEPSDVVERENFDLQEILQDDEVLVKVLAAPINPADINTIQGVYAVKPNFPFVPGNEGVMEVLQKGNDVSEFNVGDRVIPYTNAIGTFASALICPKSDILKVPNDLDVATLATIAVNPGTAYRMLKDYVQLQPGDVVIQNCANSAVGQAVIQVAHAMGIKTINVVRDRPHIQQLKEHLFNLGATLVQTEAEIRVSTELRALPKPLLAFNGVSGKPASSLFKCLNHGATMVTYGGMSKQPLVVPIGALIFNDVSLRGFWMTGWNNRHMKSQERTDMFHHLFTLVREKKLRPPPHNLVPFKDFKIALDEAMPAKGMKEQKQILVF